jgi:putative resolvase
MKTEQSELIKIGEAAKLIGCCVHTLRRWEKRGILTSTFKSGKATGGTRYYSRQVIQRLTKSCI